jgi:hypothetical protein
VPFYISAPTHAYTEGWMEIIYRGFVTKIICVVHIDDWLDGFQLPSYKLSLHSRLVLPQLKEHRTCIGNPKSMVPMPPNSIKVYR